MGSDLYMEEQHSLPKRHAALVIGVRDVLLADAREHSLHDEPACCLPGWAKEMLIRALEDAEFKP